MNAWSSSTRRCARILSRVWIGSCRIRACDSASVRTIACTNGCGSSR